MEQKPVEKTVSEEELRGNDGQEGRPAYVAKDGIVYDVSASRMWRSGQHMRRHNAGNDLTADFPAAPHDESVLQRVPRVGTLAPVPKEEPEYKTPEMIRWLLEEGPRPHPLAVHFPVAYTAATALLVLLYLLTGRAAIEVAAYYLLWGSTIMAPVAVLLGATTWWYNYGHKLTRPFQFKIGLSAVLIPLSVAALVLRTVDPNILVQRQALGWVYAGLIVLMVLTVSGLGWVGDHITFPRKRK